MPKPSDAPAGPKKCRIWMDASKSESIAAEVVEDRGDLVDVKITEPGHASQGVVTTVRKDGTDL